MMELELPLIWAILLCVAVFMYVVLDGFDLGVGILFPFAENDKDRDIMMSSVAPFWDGNETWLVFGGGGLFAAFPLAYAALMPAVYMPVGFMLIALVFRGVAFEFRFKAHGVMRRVWDQVFHYGSVITGFCQGLILGALVQGISLSDTGRFNGDMYDWLNPFSFFTGCAVVWGYTLLGSTWLNIKTCGALNIWSRKIAVVALFAVLGCIAIVSIWTPFLNTQIAVRWGLNFPELDWSKIILLAPIPLLVLFTAWRMVYALIDPQKEYTPFIYAIILFFLNYIGLLISLYPYIIPYSLTIHEAAAAPNAQGLLLVGAIILLPIILAYTAFVYWVFRGKTTVDHY